MPEYATVNKPPKARNQLATSHHDPTITQYPTQIDANDPVPLYSEPMINGRFMPGIGEPENKTNGKGQIQTKQDNPDQCKEDDSNPHSKPAGEPMTKSMVEGRIVNQRGDENEADGFIYELQGHVDWSNVEGTKRGGNDNKYDDTQSKQTKRDSVMQFVENYIYGN